MSLDHLFYPKSIAVVGASPTMGGVKLPYFQILQMIGFKGDLYPVNPKYRDINGVKSYASIDELPAGIDFAIVGVPAERSLQLIQAAARKKIKFVHFFTSGFGEEGNRELEQSLVREARKGGTRIVGPNCIGIHSPEAAVSFDYTLKVGAPGDVSFLGQSGGATSNFVRMAASRKIALNKVVSYGNQIDVGADEYLAYFAADENVRVIAAYIEDIKNPRPFLAALRETTRAKPVVILKGGMTGQGARAAASHTGALAGNHRIWASAVQQHGGILVDTFEQLIDVAMLGTAPWPLKGPRMGFLGAGGGAAVSFTDLAVQAGLSLPELNGDTRTLIGERIRTMNTSTANPVDLGFYGFDFTIMAHTINALNRDRGIDAIVPYFSIDYITTFQQDQIETGPGAIGDTGRGAVKPIIPILSKYTEDNLDVEKVRISIFSALRDAGLPVYSTIQDAVYAIARYLEWSGRCAGGAPRDR
jgi:acetyl-CoA synthetase (ADP-forming)/acetyltransferase